MTDKKFFQNMEVGAFECSGIRGTSTIPHHLRKSLGLTMEEYALLQCLDGISANRSATVTYLQIWKHLGLIKREIASLLLSLTKKEYLIIIRDEFNNESFRYLLRDKWTDNFNFDKQFDALWEIFNKKGNKVDAMARLSKVLKMIDYQMLLERAKTYQKNVAVREFQHRRGLDTWLTPDKKRWEEIESLPQETTGPTQVYKPQLGKR